MDIEAEIKRFITDELMLDDDQSEIGLEDSLLDTGLLDSIAVLRLIAFIEQKFDVRVDDNEVTPDNFETIRSMAAFLESKRGYR